MYQKSSDTVGAFFSAYLWLKEGSFDHRKRNSAMLDRIGIPEGRRIYVSRMTPTVIVLLNEDELDKAIRDECFSDWSRYGFDEPKRSSVIVTQIGADTENGTNSTYFNGGEGYSGKGMTVGVIAAENLIFDENALSLRGTDITVLPSLLPPKRDPHPTAVVSQIAGQMVTADGVTLYGVVRDAKVFFAPAKTTANVYTAIEELVSQGVEIINYSAGSVKGEYSDFDRQIDRLTRSGNFLFVTASGNRRSMTSPGRAENALTVGNLQTKDYPDTPLPPPWQVWCKAEDDCSGYNTEGVHKPDLVAPGTWVGYAVTEEKVSFDNFGTSFACPWVCGIAVAVAEALKTPRSYLTLKAIILMSCNANTVLTDGNPKISDYIRLRSGYGALDGRRAVETALSSEIFESRLDGEYNVRVRGGNLEIMLTFEKGEGTVSLVVEDESFTAGEQNTLLVKKRSKESVSPLSVIGIGGRFSLVVRST